MTTPAQDPLDAPTAALAAAVLEVARHVEDGPLPAPRLFALARSAELIAASPALASLLGAEGEGAHDDLHLTPIDLDEGAAPSGPSDGQVDPLVALEKVQWPDLAAGGAIACDLAPSAWSVRDEEQSAGDAALPSGRALRVVVAALGEGTTWSAVHRGGEDGYVLGAALLPEISEALVQTLQSGS
ncbi:PPA1309 family protein [Brachybacterium paraconglomeratum]|uniref:PPA1309 family protein n=1 Tax=Brachybacterium TaxID=43668 RepID=UPI0021DF97FC|nr:PPA1309 family protein [Brachybacterium atlanticum]